MVCNLEAKLGFVTDLRYTKQTDQSQYTPDLSMLGHKNTTTITYSGSNPNFFRAFHKAPEKDKTSL